MSLPAAFRRAAHTEFAEAATWYEARQPNLGVEFIAEIERCVAWAAEHPQGCAVIHGTIRRIVARRFPYCVYFLTEPRRIVVLAVFHGLRDPAILQARA